RSESRLDVPTTLAAHMRSISARRMTRRWRRSTAGVWRAMSTHSRMATNSRALELRDVEVVYERRGRQRGPAVAGARLTAEREQIVGLVGESGCGKSSLARAAVGLV